MQRSTEIHFRIDFGLNVLGLYILLERTGVFCSELKVGGELQSNTHE